MAEELTLRIDEPSRGKPRIIVRDGGGIILASDRLDPASADERRKGAKSFCRALMEKGFERTRGEMERLLEDSCYGHIQEKERAAAAEAAAKALAPAPPAAEADPDPEADGLRLLGETAPKVRAAAEALLRDPDLIDRVSEHIAAQGVAGEEKLALALYLVGVSRKLRRPLSARVRGPSTSGKSHVIECVAALMPPEAVIGATQLTSQALFHMPKGALRHKFVVAGERSRKQDDEVAEATRALRELQSAGEIAKWLPMKNGEGLVTMELRQKGPIAYVESTTLAEVFAEDENRALPLYTDETPEQTGRVVMAIAERHAGQDGAADATHLRSVHHAAQRLLARVEVVVPFARQLAAGLPKNRVETRRVFTFILAMVEASALLHQFQRHHDLRGRLIADPGDYRVAALLLAGSMGRLLRGTLSDPARRFSERLREWFGDAEFTAPQAKGKEPVSKQSVYQWLRELKVDGMVKEEKKGRGRKAALLRLAEPDPDEPQASVLPSLEEVCGE